MNWIYKESNSKNPRGLEILRVKSTVTEINNSRYRFKSASDRLREPQEGSQLEQKGTWIQVRRPGEEEGTNRTIFEKILINLLQKRQKTSLPKPKKLDRPVRRNSALPLLPQGCWTRGQRPFLKQPEGKEKNYLQGNSDEIDRWLSNRKRKPRGQWITHAQRPQCVPRPQTQRKKSLTDEGEKRHFTETKPISCLQIGAKRNPKGSILGRRKVVSAAGQTRRKKRSAWRETWTNNSGDCG